MRHNQSHPCGAVAVTEQTPLVVVFIHRNKPLLVVAVVGKTRNGEWRVRASDYGERVDPMERRLFGVGRKSPPEKFSGGGNRWLAAAWWPAVGGRILRERDNVPDNSPEQEAATGHPIPRRLDSPTSQAIQLPELELTLTPATGRELSQEINNHNIPILISPGPSRKRSRSPSSPFYPNATTFSDGKPASETSELNPEDATARLEDIKVEIGTLHADTEDKELLISELQVSLAAAENEIALLQIRVADVEDRHAEDHDQIQTILAHLGL
ncbi:hypothetical protein Tco_0092281 [Tanacetum coccineum]